MFKAAGSVAGAVIVIHSKDTMPFPEDYGIVLTPGVYNAIRMQKIQIRRLPYPYGDCIDENSDASAKDVYISQYNVTYSKMVSTVYLRYDINSEMQPLKKRILYIYIYIYIYMEYKVFNIILEQNIPFYNCDPVPSL